MCKCDGRCKLRGCNKTVPVPHKHAALIKAWADGAEIQVLHTGIWHDLSMPLWDAKEYRIKSVPKPDVVFYSRLEQKSSFTWDSRKANYHNVKVIYDGETGKPKSVSLLGE